MGLTRRKAERMIMKKKDNSKEREVRNTGYKEGYKQALRDLKKVIDFWIKTR